LGVEADVEIEIHRDIPLKKGDCFVLCTDGLAAVAEREIHRIVQNLSAQDACRHLVEISRRLGSSDNATVIVLKLMTDMS